MSSAIPTTEQLNACSSSLVSLLLDGLRTDRGVQIETAIWAAGGLTGLAMLRDTGIDLSALPAGQAVFSDGVEERGSVLMGQLGSFCQACGIDPNTGWVDPIEDNHRPQVSTVDLNAKFEPVAVAAYEKESIDLPHRAVATGFAAIRLIHMGAQALSPEISKALLINAVQEGAKTVPRK